MRKLIVINLLIGRYLCIGILTFYFVEINNIYSIYTYKEKWMRNFLYKNVYLQIVLSTFFLGFTYVCTCVKW